MEVLRVLVRPLRTATLLWCFLLLLTTHIWLLWLSLIVVLLQLGRRAFGLLRIALFSGPWLRKIGQAVRTHVDTALAGLDLVTAHSIPTTELKSLFSQLRMIQQVTRFLTNRELVVRWAWLLTVVFLGCVYSYMAFLFSFVYYGIARVSGLTYSWGEAFVTSLFIPFFASDLPKTAWAKLLGGVQCSLIVTLGVGTILTYIHRRLDYIRTEAITLSERFASRSVREKYVILEEKAGGAPVTKVTPLQR